MNECLRVHKREKERARVRVFSLRGDVDVHAGRTTKYLSHKRIESIQSCTSASTSRAEYSGNIAHVSPCHNARADYPCK